MRFSEQVEAKALDRQLSLQEAILDDKPIRPEKGKGWTIGDLIYFSGLLNVMLEELGEAIGEISEDDFTIRIRDLSQHA